MTTFTESEERQALRKAVADLGRKYGHDYFEKAAKEGRKTTELWQEAGRLGYLGVAVPEEFGGGGGDIGDLAAVCEELAAAGSPLLLMVVSPAIVGTNHRPVTARRSRRSAGCRVSPTGRRRSRSPSPSRTPAPTRTRSSPPPIARTADGG